MKILVIGDVHGRDDWKKVVEQAEYDTCVFIGDYFDSFDLPASTQMRNFEDIVKFKKDSEKKVVLLMGNHDLHYMLKDERYSGFQEKYEFMIYTKLHDATDHIQMAYEYNGLLFTHAGITKTWCYNINLKHDAFGFVETINQLPLTEFGFKQEGATSPHGDDIHQGPLWVRPASLAKDAVGGYTQIVGHTQVPKITHYTDTIKLIDAPEGGEYMVINVDEINTKYEFDVSSIRI